MNGLAGCYVSTIGKPHEYFDLTGKRLKLSDDDRRRLAVKAQALGREALAQIASVATPATLLRGVVARPGANR